MSTILEIDQYQHGPSDLEPRGMASVHGGCPAYSIKG